VRDSIVDAIDSMTLADLVTKDKKPARIITEEGALPAAR